MDLEQLEKRLQGYRECRVLLTAVELDVCTLVGDGSTAGEVAARGGFRGPATERLLNALVALEILTKAGDRYENTPVAARYLDTRSPECARPAWLHQARRWHTWSQLTGHVRGDAPLADYREEKDHAGHAALLATLHRRSRQRALAVVEAIDPLSVRRVLDVGGGSGAYSIAFARANPELRADVFDLPEVLPITRRYLEESGVADRVGTVAGDLLTDELGSGYDLVLLCSVTHLLGEGEMRELLPRCRRALRPEGRIAIVDHVLDADKTAPREGVLAALNMMMTTLHGGTHSRDEYESWLTAAGFGPARGPLPVGRGSLLVAARASES